MATNIMEISQIIWYGRWKLR